jgi:hypothetical protein
VAEIKNRTVIEMARTMLDEYKTYARFWVETVNTMCHATNHLYLHKLLKKTPYELLTNNKPIVSYFRVFGSKCYILQKRSKSSKFAPKYMNVSYLAMTQTHVHIVFSIGTPVVLKSHVMRCLMTLMAPKWSNMILIL